MFFVLHKLTLLFSGFVQDLAVFLYILFEKLKINKINSSLKEKRLCKYLN